MFSPVSVGLYVNRITVAPFLSDAPTNGSFSGFLPGRVTKVRSGLNGVLGSREPEAIIRRRRRSGLTSAGRCLYACI